MPTPTKSPVVKKDAGSKTSTAPKKTTSSTSKVSADKTVSKPEISITNVDKPEVLAKTETKPVK